MTIGFCDEIRIIKPCTTVDTVPVDFKLDSFTLKGVMRIFTFSRQLSRSI